MDFDTALTQANNLAKSPTNDELLEIYGLFKQASIGDVNIPRPGMLDIRGKAKWDNWNDWKGTSIEDAKQKYIAVVQRLVDKYGVK